MSVGLLRADLCRRGCDSCTLPYGGFCSCGGETWAWEARGGGKPFNEECKKKIHAFYWRGVVCVVVG